MTVETTPSARQQLEAYAPAALAALPRPVLVVAPDGRILARNESARIFPDGATIEPLLADLRFFDEVDPSALLKDVIAASASRTLDAAWLRPQGGMTLMTVTFTPMSGTPSPAVLLLFEERAANVSPKAFEVSRRLASLGRLAARVAHELNNPLDGTLRYVNLALRLIEHDHDDRLRAYLNECRSGLKRMAGIVTDLLEFTRSTDGTMEEADVNQIVEQVIRLHAPEADAAGIVLTADFQTQAMPLVTGTRLHQVCDNLIRNALDAMPRGGRITVTTALVASDVLIEVADTGPGLPDPPEKVFEPFYTTKPPGEGTGLGLAICKDFVEDYGGTLSARNGEDGGAVFTVRIPVAALRASGRAFDRDRGRTTRPAPPDAQAPS